MGITGFSAELGERPGTRRSRQRNRGDGQDNGVPARPGSAIGGMHVERCDAGRSRADYESGRNVAPGVEVPTEVQNNTPLPANSPGNPLLKPQQQQYTVATAPVVPQRSANRPAAGKASNSSRVGRHIVQNMDSPSANSENGNGAGGTGTGGLSPSAPVAAR